jgi:hypothetical protein
MKRRKSTKTVRRVRHPITRRRALGTLAAGAGAMVLAGTSVQSLAEVPIGSEEDPGQWVSWHDGWAYLILGITEQEGWWIVGFPEDEESGEAEGLYAVDPAGWVFDSAVWYPIVETTEEGVWFAGDDGYDYLHVHQHEYVLDIVGEQLETA